MKKGLKELLGLLAFHTIMWWIGKMAEKKSHRQPEELSAPKENRNKPVVRRKPKMATWTQLRDEYVLDPDRKDAELVTIAVALGLASGNRAATLGAILAHIAAQPDPNAQASLPKAIADKIVKAEAPKPKTPRTPPAKATGRTKNQPKGKGNRWDMMQQKFFGQKK